MKFSTIFAAIGSSILAVVPLVALEACSSSGDAGLGANADLADGAARGGSSGAASSGGGAGGLSGQTLAGIDPSVVTALCGSTGCACSNGLDDDKDGLVDGLDPECTGPLDNDESSFATGIAGDNVDPKWQDCFFDGNSGGGDDGCRYSTDCLTGKLPQTDKNCVLSQQCVDFCKPFTPNGCDCFGCCTIQTKSGSVDVLTGTKCSADKLSDPTACPVCKKSDSCNNTCGTCELCIGKTAADLPASCTPTITVPDGAPPPPAYTCDNGHAVCSDSIACPANFYCQLGCCMPILR